MPLIGGPSLGGLRLGALVAYLENTIMTITFKTDAATGNGTFRPTFSRVIGSAPLQWTFPDASNTLGVATYSGDLPSNFTFTTAGTKTVTVNAPDWDSFKELSCISCKLVEDGLVFNSSKIFATLQNLQCRNNSLTSLTMPSSAPALSLFRCDGNSLTSLTMPSSAPALSAFSAIATALLV